MPNGIAPGAILWPEHEMSEEARAQIIARTALKRQGHPEDIARAVLFLVRDADYMTGEIIAVDGGRSLSIKNFLKRKHTTLRSSDANAYSAISRRISEPANRRSIIRRIYI